MDLITTLYFIAGSLVFLFVLGLFAEIWLWRYPGFVLRAKRARRQARYGR